MFLSNNSSTSLNNNNNNCFDQQPMFDRPFFINDVSPSSRMYPAVPPSIHDQLYSSSFTHTFNSDHQNSSAADDHQDFIISAFLQQHHQEDLLVGHQFFSQIQHPNTSTTPPPTTTTTSSSISKQTGITTTTTDHHTNLAHLNNMINMEMISNKNNVDDGNGGGSRCEPAVTLWKKKTSTTSKKDRHSKIITAQGPRDRRMRLSLEIARRFFTLQDMLGFDKASKTVEWLLTKSKGAIKELTRSIKGSSNSTSGGGSSTSECEVVSVFDHTPNVNDDDDENTVQISNSISSKPKEKRVRVTRKPTFHPPPLAKDSRVKARARARERTIEKMRSRSTVSFPNNIDQLRANSSSYETGGEESGSQSHDMSLEMMAEVEDHQPAAAARSPSLECQGPIGEEYPFVITRNSPTTTTTTTTSPLFFDYNHAIKTSQGLNLNNNNCNFPENWDIDSAVEHTLAIPSQTTCIYQQQIFTLSASHGSHS